MSDGVTWLIVRSWSCLRWARAGPRAAPLLAAQPTGGGRRRTGCPSRPWRSAPRAYAYAVSF